ncbi:hypothetical protein ABFS82_14G187800 [Erythranthe guttata]
MGSSYNNILFLFTFLSLTYISSADLKSNVCWKTKDPAYCFKFVKPLYRKGITPIDFTNATLQASKTVLYLVYLDILGREAQASKTNNPVLSSQYKLCKPTYEYAVDGFNQCQLLTELPNPYKRMSYLAGRVLLTIQTLELVFGANGMPADLKALHQNSINVCDIVFTLTLHLATQGAP